jgi:hypothetical protein
MVSFLDSERDDPTYDGAPDDVKLSRASSLGVQRASRNEQSGASGWAWKFSH